MNLKSLKLKKLSVLLLVSAFSLMGNKLSSSVFAETSAPSFPSCGSKIFTSNGDKAHYDYGIHGIVGVGVRTGSDDVYTLDSGNYLQCYCPTNGESGVKQGTGIQSDWWNVQRSGLSQDTINTYKSTGWFEENGKDWGLTDETYLIRNSEFSCTQVTPTVTPMPTVTVTPTMTPTPTASPTPTQVPSVTPTPGPQGPESKCYDLEAQPSEGTAPLTVKFIGHADDPATNGKIKQYRFDFADASGGQQQVWFQTDATAYHRYELSGEYEATLRIQDNAGNWRESDDCKVKIKVNTHPKVLGASSPTELPTTGLPAALIASVLPMVYAGLQIYRRFKLV